MKRVCLHYVLSHPASRSIQKNTRADIAQIVEQAFVDTLGYSTKNLLHVRKHEAQRIKDLIAGDLTEVLAGVIAHDGLTSEPRVGVQNRLWRKGRGATPKPDWVMPQAGDVVSNPHKHWQKP
jgi:hypothetical protein